MKVLIWSLGSLIAAGVIFGALILLGPFRSGMIGPLVPRENPVASSGKQVYHLEVDGVSREFIVYRPDHLSATQEVPVVFVFHGTTGTGEKFYTITNWKSKADSEGFMTVYPTSLKYHVFDDEKVVKGEVKNAVSSYTTKWNAYELPSLIDPKYPDQVLADDVAFTRQMVSFINENYATDESRFYATGFSNGAQMVSRLAVETSDIFAAFAPAGAGMIYDQVLSEIAAGNIDFVPRPVLQTIGEVDPKISHYLGVSAINMTASAAEDGDPVKDKFISGFLELEDLKDVGTYELKGPVAHYGYKDSEQIEGGGSYDLLLMKGMGHIYPNGKNYPIDIVNILWPFFSRFSL
ncbi:MAG TPA: dienelactone hydrolase family protein [bacterium]|nr:dienelactone hydrolase family protein [bacterium]